MNTFIKKLSVFASLLFPIATYALNVGDPSPNIVAKNQDNQEVNLGDQFNNGISMVFFYPKADTPGCTKQACSMRDSFEELQAHGVNVFGVSYDSPEKQKAFIEKYSLPYDLIADKNKAVSQAFGRSGWSRQAFLIKDGILIWKDEKASTKSQAADVKQALIDLDLLHFSSMQ